MLKEWRRRKLILSEWQFDYLEENEIITEAYMTSMTEMEKIDRHIKFYTDQLTEYQKYYIEFARVERCFNEDENKLWFHD